MSGLDTALAFAEYGFPVFSVWGIDNGVCRCPKGKTCTSPGKHPIPVTGFKAGTTNPDAITKMLSSPGSGGNYGVGPVEGVIYLDPDTPDWKTRVRELGLPPTTMVLTGNGAHLYYAWPAEYGPAPSTLFGWVVRSSDHPGYVVGPGSAHANGSTYRFAKQNGHSDFEMLARIAVFPKALVPQQTITVTGPKAPESVMAGEGRHDYLRDTARYLRGRGLTGEALFAAVDAVNQRFPQPKSAEEVQRAIGRAETKFGEDPVELTPEEVVATVPNLIVPIATYRAAQPINVEWVSPLAAYGYVSLISGPPKSGKSTLVSNLLAARENGTPFLWGDPVPKGPTLLVTEESGFAVVRKTVGLTTLDVLDRRAFVLAGLSKLDHLLAALMEWCKQQEERALILIDTLAIWGDIKDENDAVAANKAVSSLAVFAQVTQAALDLIHHARKGGGDHGEAIRGSNAIFGAVDHSVELAYPLGQGDARRLTLSGRLDFPETRTLDFDRDTMTYSLSNEPPPDDFKLATFPVDDGKVDGLTRQDAEKLWDLRPSGANNRLRELVAKGLLVRRDVKSPTDRVPHGEYWRTPPLLDVRSVGEEFADIFRRDED